MTEYKAIETIYNGYRFRSRLEARWAVFFDAAGIRYEYEPEGFELGEDWGWDPPLRYLPDFYFPDWDIYGEVKPSLEKLKEDEEKLAWMVDYGGPMWKGLLILGQIPNTSPSGIPTLYVLLNRHKGVALALCTILKEKFICERTRTYLLVEDYDVGNEAAPELPIHTYPESPLFETTYSLHKRLEIPGFYQTLSMGISFSELKNLIPFDAYTKARQARFEYGETPKATEGI